MTREMNITQLNRRIDEAAAWCASRADQDNPKSSLRSLDIAPNTLDVSRSAAVESTC